MDQLPLTAGDIAAATGGLLTGDPQHSVQRVSIDSRTVGDGDFFVAIRGERFDGHEFFAEAGKRGARGFVVDRAWVEASGFAALSPGRALIQVDDTTLALQAIARDVRRRSGAKVVAITGSAGKTTTKEITAELLSLRYRVFRNQGNLNNHIGLPLSLLELRSQPEVAVVELGMNHPGEIRALVRVAEPEVRVWTNVGDAHMGFFASAEEIADAKGEIVEQGRPGDVLVANANDPLVMARARAFAGTLITFGMDTAADVEARDVQLRGLEGTSARVRTRDGEAQIHTPLLGLGNLSNVLAGLAVATHFSVPLAEAAAKAAGLRPAYHRGELLRLPGGITLIDDSYNSSPSALKRALETVRAATGSARKAAVLGEMLELGDHAQTLHAECGRAAAAAGLDLLVVVGGPAARALADAAIEAGMAESSVVHAANKDEAAEVARQRIRPGDLVLVKGSRGIGTDLVVDRLKAEFA